MIIVLPGSLNQGGVRTGNGAASTLTPGDGMAIAQLPHVAGGLADRHRAHASRRQRQ